MLVLVCTWDPLHTLKRADAQQRAVQTGWMAELVKQYPDKEELRAALAAEGLLTYTTSEEGERCADCNGLMDRVLSRPKIESKADAIRDVAQDFDKAIDRTRAARARGEL